MDLATAQAQLLFGRSQLKLRVVAHPLPAKAHEVRGQLGLPQQVLRALIGRLRLCAPTASAHRAHVTADGAR